MGTYNLRCSLHRLPGGGGGGGGEGESSGGGGGGGGRGGGGGGDDGGPTGGGEGGGTGSPFSCHTVAGLAPVGPLHAPINTAIRISPLLEHTITLRNSRCTKVEELDQTLVFIIHLL